MKNSNNELAHVGVLGMHWGIRRGSKTSSSSGGSSGSSSNSSSDHMRATIIKKKKLEEMTNDEIRELATRVQLEAQYRDITKRKASLGEKIVTDALTTAGKTVLTAVITKQMTKAAGKLLGESAKQAEQVTKGKEEAIQQVKDQVEKAAEVIQKSRYTDAEKKAMIKKAEELEAQAADNIVKLGRAQFLQAVKHPPTVVLPIQDTIKLIPIKK